MKKKIFDALKTEYASLGLSDNTLNRIASVLEGSVTKEEDIVTAVKGDTAKLLATSIQGEIDGIKRAKESAEQALADYKAKHPEKNPPTPPAGLSAEDISNLIKQGIEDGIKPFKDSFDALKSQVESKDTVSTVKTAFFANGYAGKYKEEADDAWERAMEIYEAGGSKMTSEELTKKVNEYFGKLVSKKGVDTSKPFEAEDQNKPKIPDFSADVKHLEDEGKIAKEK